MITVYADGSINGHVKKEAIQCHAAWYAVDEANRLIHYEAFDMGINPAFSATTAEYEAIFSAMFWLAGNAGDDYLIINSDSQVAIRQLQGVYQCHSKNLWPYLEGCEELEACFARVEYVWIPRESNQVADILSKSLQDKHGPGRQLTPEEVQKLIDDAAAGVL